MNKAQEYLHLVSLIVSLLVAVPVLLWFRESVFVVVAVSLWTWTESAWTAWLESREVRRNHS